VWRWAATKRLRWEEAAGRYGVEDNSSKDRENDQDEDEGNKAEDIMN
jgi:hypothetical protein